MTTSTPVFVTLLVFNAILIIAAFFALTLASRGSRSLTELCIGVLASLSATILSWYLAIITLGGDVGDTIPLPLTNAGNITALVENGTTLTTTTIEHTTLFVATVDPVFGLLLSGVAAILTTISFGLVIHLGLEIIQEV